MDSKINAKLLAECCHIVNLAGGDSYSRGQYAMAVLREYRRREIEVEQPARAQNTDGGMNRDRWEHVLQDARLNKQLLGVLLEFLVENARQDRQLREALVKFLSENAVLYPEEKTDDGVVYGVCRPGEERGKQWEPKAW